MGEALEVPPGQIRFLQDLGSKPVVADAAGIDVSLSHTRGFAACAVSQHGRIGVDVEAAARSVEIETLRESVFTNAERRMLDECAVNKRAERMVWLWTAKEALLKGCGRGLAIPPASIDLRWSDSGELAIAAFSEGREWKLVRFRVDEEFLGSLALERASAIEVRCFDNGKLRAGRRVADETLFDLSTREQGSAKSRLPEPPRSDGPAC